MQINERLVADLTILDVSGKLTGGDGAQRLQDKIESLIFQKRTHVILNLAEVPYIDSGGLGQLVSSYSSFARAGGRLTLINLNARNNDLLAITKLVAVFETFETEEAALESYPAAVRTAVTE